MQILRPRQSESSVPLLTLLPLPGMPSPTTLLGQDMYLPDSAQGQPSCEASLSPSTILCRVHRLSNSLINNYLVIRLFADMFISFHLTVRQMKPDHVYLVKALNSAAGTQWVLKGLHAE